MTRRWASQVQRRPESRRFGVVSPFRILVVAGGILLGGESSSQTEISDRRSLDSAFWAEFRDGRIVQPCDRESEDAERAIQVLRELDDRISDLAPGDEHEPIVRSLHDLLRTPCFLLAMEVDRLPRPDSAESLMRWWSNGGHYWVSSYIRLPREGREGDLRPQIVVPPDDRPTLSPRTGVGERLGALLCNEGDEECRAETLGWRRRAQEAIETLAGNRRIEQLDESLWLWRTDAAHDVLEESVRQACVEEADDSEYREFRQCVDSLIPRRRVLPLGAIRSPSSGWLLVAGRRGHYQHCDGVAAYHLTNGEAFRARRCSNLVLEEGGKVDFVETEERATTEVDVGFVNVENLREAAWMLLLLPQTEELRPRAAFLELPREMERRLDTGRRGQGRTIGYGTSWSTSQTQLSWSIVRPDLRIEGRTVWPGSEDPAEEHVARLLDVAESGWRAGCPNEPPPSSAFDLLAPGVNRGDADPDRFQRTMRELTLAILDWAPERCDPAVSPP